MFSGRRLLWVRNAQGQKALADDVKALCAEPSTDATILIEAGDLKKRLALRTAVEAAKTALALPCYMDDAGAVDSVIDDELSKAGLTIDQEARALLKRNLGGDRMATRAEVAKLALYALGQREISADDVRALTGDVSAVSVDLAVDAVLAGDLQAFDTAFSRLALGPSQVYTVLSATQRQLQTLQQMRAAMSGTSECFVGRRLGQAARLFSRRRLVEQALGRWTSLKLGRLLAALHDTVLATQAPRGTRCIPVAQGTRRDRARCKRR